MSTATQERQPTKTPELVATPKTESIFEYYSVKNEIDFLRSQDPAKVSPKDAHFYVEENVYRFLGEFAGNVPYTRITYMQDRGALTYAGIDLTDSYEKTAKIGGEREFDEMVGYRKIQQGFARGANSATWISPPKIADYGFVFHFARDREDPRKVKEYIFRYDERRGELKNSQAILDRIDPTQSHSNDRGFLQTPSVAISAHSESADAEYVMRAVGIDEEKIAQSVKFEKTIRKELAPWVSQYVRAVEVGNIKDAETILTATFNRARDIAEGKPSLIVNNRIAGDISGTQFLAQYSKKSAMVTGGGSCPVTRAKNSDPFAPKSLTESLTGGTSVSKLLEENESSHFVCPKCDYHASGPVGDACPSCKLTKEEYAQKGGAVC